jgi:hypothetical protein
MKFFEVFKAGTYPQGKFTKTQIEELAKNYDPQFCEAPITLDHEQKGPAYGWVSELQSENGKLKAGFKDLSDDLKEFVQSGKYKKISVEIYRNLEGKQPYLKAVSFLGAGIPQVKGMGAVEFKEGESDIYVFETEVEDIEQYQARIDELEKETASFKENNKKTETIKALKFRIETLETDLAKFKEEADGKSELEKELNEIKASVKKREFDGFIDKQLEAGTLVPANKDVIFSVLNELDNLKKFGSEVNVIDDFKSFIETLPKQVEFQEIAAKEKTTTQTNEAEKFANADEESLAIFKEAAALAEKEKISFKEALLKLDI